ncbi:MAG: class I SAM-dependent methyltransferase [Acidimicrobiia bacterium]
MAVDRERFGAGGVPPWVHREHVARWEFASGFVSGRRVADCACGVGDGTAMFASAGAASVRAFDVSPDAVAATTQRCAALDTVEVAEASAAALPLEDASIDVFVCLETIEHVADDHRLVEELARVVADDGVLICSTPNRSVTMPGKTISDAPWNPFHVREYSHEEFATLLGARFGTIEMFGQNPRRGWRVRVMAALGRVLPGNLGGRLTSVLKLPRLAFDREHHHAVVNLPAGGTCEYLVAVCRHPRRSP